MLSLIMGFVLQQAWDPTLDIDGYREVLGAMIDQFLLVDPGEVPPNRRPRPSPRVRTQKEAI
jgi:hypothetical protein